MCKYKAVLENEEAVVFIKHRTVVIIEDWNSDYYFINLIVNKINYILYYKWLDENTYHIFVFAWES
mgnify:CR=1 FL=1